MPEIERAAEQRGRQGDERRGDIEQRLYAQQLAHDRLAVIGGGQRGERELPCRQRAVHQQQHPEHLPEFRVG